MSSRIKVRKSRILLALKTGVLWLAVMCGAEDCSAECLDQTNYMLGLNLNFFERLQATCEAAQAKIRDLTSDEKVTVTQFSSRIEAVAMAKTLLAKDLDKYVGSRTEQSLRTINLAIVGLRTELTKLGGAARAETNANTVFSRDPNLKKAIGDLQGIIAEKIESLCTSPSNVDAQEVKKLRDLLIKESSTLCASAKIMEKWVARDLKCDRDASSPVSSNP